MQKKKILMALLVSSILTPSVSVFAEEMTDENLVSESTSIVQFEVAEDDEEPLKDEDFIAFWLRYQENGQTKELTAPFRAVKKYFPNYTYSDINNKIFEEEYPDLEYKDLIYYLPHGYDFVSTQSALKEATWKSFQSVTDQVKKDREDLLSDLPEEARSGMIPVLNDDFCWTISIKEWETGRSTPKELKSGLPVYFKVAYPLEEESTPDDQLWAIPLIQVDNVDDLNLDGTEAQRLSALNEAVKKSDSNLAMLKPFSKEDLVELKAGNEVIAYVLKNEYIDVESNPHPFEGDNFGEDTKPSEGNNPVEEKKFTADNIEVLAYAELDGSLHEGTPYVHVSFHGGSLSEDRDYTYKVIKPATKFGDTGLVAIIGKGDYASTGTIQKEYTVCRNLNNAKVTNTSSNGYFLDKAPSSEKEAIDTFKKIIKVTWGDITLKYGEDYTISILSLPKGEEKGSFKIEAVPNSNYKFWSGVYSVGGEFNPRYYPFWVKTSSTTDSSSNSNSSNSNTSTSSPTLSNVNLDDIKGVSTKEGNLKSDEREALEKYVNNSSKYNPNNYDFTIKSASVTTSNGKSTITMTATAKLNENSLINLILKNLEYENAFIEEVEDGFIGFEETETVSVEDLDKDGKKVTIKGITVKEAFRVNGTIDSVAIKRILTNEGYDVAKLDFSSKTSSEDTFNIKSLTAPISIEVSHAPKPVISTPVGGASSGSNTTVDTPQTPAQKPTTVKKQTYRFFNTLTGEHFYTTSEAERDQLMADSRWNNEGQGWIAPEFSNFPIYRLCNPNTGEHHYTVDKNEYDTLQTIGWKGEGIGFYSADSKDSNAVQLHRLYNPNATDAGSHHYTVDENEKNTLVAQGWKYEGIAWHGLKAE